MAMSVSSSNSRDCDIDEGIARRDEELEFQGVTDRTKLYESRALLECESSKINSSITGDLRRSSPPKRKLKMNRGERKKDKGKRQNRVTTRETHLEIGLILR